MKTHNNPWLGKGLPDTSALANGDVSKYLGSTRDLFKDRLKIVESPLLNLPELANSLGVGAVLVKDERNRAGLGSFKALGAAYAIAKRAVKRVEDGTSASVANALNGFTFACASAGNHGLSLATGAPAFGAEAVVFVAETVPEAFAERLKKQGARVVRAGANYEASMEEAQRQADENDWILLPDSTWPGMVEAGRDVMEGYLIMGEEIAQQISEPPTHVFLQAGVGGLAAACAVSARETWGDEVKIVIVEPEDAPALQASIDAGKAVVAPGPVSIMGRLDCKEPSHLALKYLASEANAFVTISDSEAAQTVSWLAARGFETTPSGAAGLSALHHASDHFAKLGLSASSRVLCYLSEGPEDV
ncbi:MAG: pyridoxal-phosphate dependent enzyme [Roseibium sp.]|uniref:pyridoxal-phosphate dependent enzyme n=1 Tax=Roseibium sp. TaxID=1936156 RepID=UPI001B232027|nr:pyridoxal-phosphate dependent enzyme [Roseibium sp.]MBO6892077.1 pyridoxal-phosphate dependent enzyme [Roseibium sp.]MBO6930449.1 pyridoxal-phosphate dependent enzyme [Roseibium sp.]